LACCPYTGMADNTTAIKTLAANFIDFAFTEESPLSVIRSMNGQGPEDQGIRVALVPKRKNRFNSYLTIYARLKNT
jgi:hypothetical protein